jgi:subtilisin family serine protease
MNLAKVFSISLPDTSFKSTLINSLNSLSEVLYAESDGDAITKIIPADGRFGLQWNMKNPLIPGADIHAEAAWDIFRGNPNSIIAIIDNGVDITHNDLAAKINGGDIGFTITTLPGTTTQISHGSIAAGIAAAVTNNTNNNGVAGVDWQAKIHPRYVIDNNSGDAAITNRILNALNFSPNVWTFNHSWQLTNIDSTPGRYSVTIRSAFANGYRSNRVSCVAMGNHQAAFPNVPAFPARNLWH